jgi:pimeloyl-ACP methyl ester carboxylesterase
VEAQSSSREQPRTVEFRIEPVRLTGELTVAVRPRGLVIFPRRGSRRSPYDRHLVAELRQAGLSTLLFDLLTAPEEERDRESAFLRFDIALLSHRLISATRWALQQPPPAAGRPLGYFATGTGAAAAFVAAARLGPLVRAVVSSEGRPDLAGTALPRVQAPTLLIVGGDDAPVLNLNRKALGQFRCPSRLVTIPGASQPFEEEDARKEASRLAARWFAEHFWPAKSSSAGAGDSRIPVYS